MATGTVVEVLDGGQRLMVEFPDSLTLSEIRLSRGKACVEMPTVGQLLVQEESGYIRLLPKMVEGMERS